MYQGKHYINGEFVDGCRQFEFDDINPCNGNVIGKFPNANGTEVNAAVQAARDAYPAWRSMSRIKRAELLDEFTNLVKQAAGALACNISLETGKSLNESLAEVNEAIHMAQYAAAQGRQAIGEVFASEIADKQSYTLRKPKGVVGIISPWNFPLNIGGFWCAAPALVEGNTVVWKPSPETGLVAQQIMELYHAAGFPPGVINLVHGEHATGSGLVISDVDVILFTGSREVGMGIRQHAAKTNKIVSCELGSKSAVIVFENSDHGMALDACVASAFKLSGQRCVSAGRLLVERSMYEWFCTSFASRARNIMVGDPFSNPAPFCGPLITKGQQERVQAYNQMVREDKSCDVIVDGVVNDYPNGYFVHPFVYKCNWGNKRFLKEEVFGPHVAIIPFDRVDDAINIYNDTDYGLALGVMCDDARVQRRLINECDYGMIYLNAGSIAAESHLLFGGVKASGNGYKSAAGTWRAVTEEVTVTYNYGTTLQFPQGMTN